MSIERTPENLRKIAQGQHYPPKLLRQALAGSADDLQAAMDEIQDQRRLLDNLSMTIAAIVIASGSEVSVPKAVLEELGGYELEKAPGDPSTDIEVIYRTRRKGGVS